MSDIILNDRITHEPCPTCGMPATCEHGERGGKRVHLWRCPECGDCLSFVGYDCVDCVVAAAEAQLGVSAE
jgi:predicted RNA-binding Zn-ribbon protein involved in translation (DUF1610 family)